MFSKWVSKCSSPRVHERDAGPQLVVDHDAGSFGGLLAGLDLPAQPVVQVLRDVLQEQHDARRGPLHRLDPAADPRPAAPVRDSAFHVGQLLGERLSAVGQDPPVVHQGEALVVPGEHPAGRHDLHGELPPGAEPGAADGADAVVTEDRQPEQVRRGANILGAELEIGQAHLLDEDRGAVDVQQNRLPADAGSDRYGGVHELTQPAITAQRQCCGHGAVGGQTGTAGHVRALQRCLQPGTRSSCGQVGKHHGRFRRQPLTWDDGHSPALRRSTLREDEAHRADVADGRLRVLRRSGRAATMPRA